VYPEGGTVILKGNLAPEGAVVKQSGIQNRDMLVFQGEAICFNSEREAIQAVADHVIHNGHVVVIRYEGPKGGPGMPELLAFTFNLLVRKDLTEVAMITDGRFSGFTAGPCIGHVSPEAYVGGPLAAVQEGDIIKIDVPNHRLDIELTDEEIQDRLNRWTPYERETTSKVLLKYRALVTSASNGAILKF
jgi:dihydroxy-acid dehydratase